MTTMENLEQPRESVHLLTDASRAAIPRPSDGPQPPQTPAPLAPEQEDKPR